MRYILTPSFWRFVGGFALLVGAGLAVVALMAPSAERELGASSPARGEAPAAQASAAAAPRAAEGAPAAPDDPHLVGGKR